jgi:hypothetical protein
MLTAARYAPQGAPHAVPLFLLAVLVALLLTPSTAFAASPGGIRQGFQGGGSKALAYGLDADLEWFSPDAHTSSHWWNSGICCLGRDVTLRAGAKTDSGNRSYRLADDRHLYRTSSIRTTGITAGAYVDIAPVQGFTTTVGLEYDMKRTYEFRNGAGVKMQSIKVGNSPSFQIILGYRF